MLGRLDGLRARARRSIDGLEYHEGLNAVGIAAASPATCIPDECVVTVNYRFAPDRSEAEAEAHVREVFDGLRRRRSPTPPPGALPGPATCRRPRRSSRRVGGEVDPKFGWTDVARFPRSASRR